MKRALTVISAACLLLCAGCSEESSAAEPAVETPQGMEVTAAENLDPDYKDVIAAYFTALETQDFEAYQATVYPPYQAAYGAYLESNGSSLQEAFDDLCHNFDEDGYDSWQLTGLSLSYYGEEPEDLTYFFQAYTEAGIYDEQFVADTQADAEEMRDVVFRLSALYEGDEEPVVVVPKGEMIVIRTGEGVFLFG